jgi:hypothetical protein
MCIPRERKRECEEDKRFHRLPMISGVCYKTCGVCNKCWHDNPTSKTNWLSSVGSSPNQLPSRTNRQNFPALIIFEFKRHPEPFTRRPSCTQQPTNKRTSPKRKRCFCLLFPFLGLCFSPFWMPGAPLSAPVNHQIGGMCTCMCV